MVDALKYLFGLPCGVTNASNSSEANIKYIFKLASVLGSSKVREHVNSLLDLLEKPSESVISDEVISSVSKSLVYENQGPSKIQKISNFSADRLEHLNLDTCGAKFMWECPENLRQNGQSSRRKPALLEGTNRPESTTQSVFSRGSGQFAAPSGPTRRDTFRLRKPNTSRPPSMHVDDYVARERNDSTTSSNVIAIPRLGSSSGRPPSIHVDEFMARERERHNPVGMAGTTQVKTAPPENDPDSEKMNKSKPLRPDLDDDLQGVDIVFGGEDSGSDDGLPFPQPDDNLPQPPSEQNSPHSIVEETESDTRLGTPLKSNFDDNNNNNNQSDFSSRISVSRPDMSLTREPSISSEKKFFEMSDKPEKISRVSSSVNVKNSRSLNDNRNFYPNSSQGQAGNSRDFYEKKFPLNQPPLPPMPPPPTISPVTKPHDSNRPTPFQNSMRDAQPPLPPVYHAHSDYGRTSHPSSSGSMRPQPPLPSTPPPYMSALPLRTSAPQSSAYNQSNIGPSDLMPNFSPNMPNLSFPPMQLMPQMMFNRPGVPYNLYGTTPNMNQVDNQSSLAQSFPIGLSSLPPVTQLQPLQPPQLPRGPHPPPQHLRPPGPSSAQSDMQPANAYYHAMMQQENFSHTQQQQQQQQQRLDPQPQVQLQQGQSSNFQQQDASALSLQHIFSSPEAIMELLGDREKLVLLLEQHPKLMQMLQDKL